MKNSNSLYIENQELIQIKAKKFTKFFPQIGYDEFLSQANYTFVKCLKKRLSKEDFRTYLNVSLDKELIRLACKSPDFVEMTPSIQNKYSISRTSVCLPFEEWVETLSDKGKELVKIVFTAPLRSISDRDKRITIKCLAKYTRKRKGWTRWEFVDRVREIKTKLGNTYVQ